MRTLNKVRRLTEKQRTSIQYLVDHGLYGWVIAGAVKCTVSQVYAVAKAYGMRLVDYRRGESVAAERVIKRTPCIVVGGESKGE